MQDKLPDKILVIDDDESVGRKLAQELGRFQVGVILAKDFSSAMYKYNNSFFEVVVIELEFEPPGLVIAQKWRAHTEDKRANPGVILITGRKRTAGDDRLAKELGGIEIVHKPISGIQLLPFIARAYAARHRQEKYQETQQKVYKLADKLGKVDKAIVVLEKELPNLGNKGIELMADLYEKNENWDGALDRIEELLKIQPENLGWQNRKARILLRKGDTAKAMKLMEEINEQSPKNIERINEMATAYLKLHQPDKSVEKMKELIDLTPEDPNMKFDLFSQLYEYGYDEHAQGLCKETTSPMDVVRYYNNRGVALSKSGNVEDAITEYERAVKFYPKFKENYRIYYNIALANLSYKTRASYESALEYLEKCLALSPRYEKGLKTKEKVMAALQKNSERNAQKKSS